MMRTRRSGTKVRTDFPGDSALQQVHSARKALQDKAKRKGLSLGAYIRSMKILEKTAGKTGTYSPS